MYRKAKIRIAGWVRGESPRKNYLEIEGTIKEQVGSDEDIASMALDAEIAANGGPTRVHIFLEK